MIYFRNSMVVFLVVAVVSPGGKAMADWVSDTEPAVTFPTNPRTGIGLPQPDGLTIGWSFTLDSKRPALHLGIYNYNFSGQADYDRPVGIWDDTGALVATATIPAGSGGGEVDGPSPLNYIYRELSSPVLLQASETYTIGAWYGGNNSPGLCYGVADTPMSGLNIVTYSLIGAGGGLNMPTTDYSGSYAKGFFGPNVRFGPVIPEPSAFFLAVLGLLALLGWGRRRRR